MKALAKAQRLARQREAQGLPPQEFVLPPTSMTPSGKRKPKQPGATVKKRKREMNTSEFDNDIPALPDSIDLVSGPAEPRLDTQLDEAHADDLPSLPRYAMFPNNDVGSVHSGSGFYAEGDERVYTHASDSNYLESHLSAPVSAHVDNVPQEYAALMTGAGAEEAGHVEAHGPALQDPAYDPSAYGNDAASQQSMQHTGTYNQHAYGGHYHDYTSNLGNFGTLPLQTNTHYPLPAFQAFHDRAQQQQHISPVSPYGTPGHGQFMLSGQDQEQHSSELPPPPSSVAKTKSHHQKRRIDTLPGEKRKRGPAVKKLAADEGMPEWTDEQWEAERIPSHRQKGYGWVAETKAAAEAERQNRALKAAGLSVNNGRRASKTLQELQDARAERLHHSHDDLSLQDDMHLQEDDDDVAQLQAQAQELEQQHQLEHQQQMEQAFDTVVHDAHFGVAATSLHDQEQAVAAAVAAHHQPADPFGTFSAVEASMIPYQTTEDAHFAANPDDYYNAAAPVHLHAAYTTDHMQDHMLQATHHYEDAQ
jgi:hypothetical protein